MSWSRAASRCTCRPRCGGRSRGCRWTSEQVAGGPAGERAGPPRRGAPVRRAGACRGTGDRAGGRRARGGRRAVPAPRRDAAGHRDGCQPDRTCCPWRSCWLRSATRLRVLHSPMVDVPGRHRSLGGGPGLELPAAARDPNGMPSTVPRPSWARSTSTPRLRSPAAPDDVLASADVMADLLDASLLSSERLDGRRGFRMLQSVRAYGRSHLAARGEIDSADEAHADHFLSLLVRAGQDLQTPAFASWVERLTLCYPDVRQALAWSLAHQPRARTLAAALGLFGFWYRTGDPREADVWSAAMLAGRCQGAPPELQGGRAHLLRSFACDLLTRPGEERPSMPTRRSGCSARPGTCAGWRWRCGGGRASPTRGGPGHGGAAVVPRPSRCAPRPGTDGGVLPRWSNLALARRHGGRPGSGAGHGRGGPRAAPRARRHPGPDRAQPVAADRPGGGRHRGCASGTRRTWSRSPPGPAGTLRPSDTWWRRCSRGATSPRAGDVARRELLEALDAGLENHFRIALRNLALLASRRDDPDRAATLVGASRRGMPQYGLDPRIYGEVEGACRERLGRDGPMPSWTAGSPCRTRRWWTSRWA